MPSGNTNALNYRQQQYNAYKQKPRKNARNRSAHSKYNRSSTTPRNNPSFNMRHVAVVTLLASSLLLSSWVTESKNHNNTDLPCTSANSSRLIHHSSIKIKNPTLVYTVSRRTSIISSEQTIKPTPAYAATTKDSAAGIEYNQKITSTTITSYDTKLKRQIVCKSASKIGLCHQPSLEKDIIKEAYLFLQLLQPYSKLSEDKKAASTLLMIQDRVNSFATYGYDIDTEGRNDFWSDAAHILADQAKGIDCEDFATLHNFYAEIAQEYNFLPKHAIFGMFDMGPYHSIFLYTSIKKDRQEAYILDEFASDYVFENKRLPTLKEYIKYYRKPFERGLEPMLLEDIVIKYNIKYHVTASLVESGGIDIIPISLDTNTIKILIESDNCDLFKNFSSNEFIKQQKDQLRQLPEYEHSSSFRNRINALQKKDHLHALKYKSFYAYMKPQRFPSKPKKAYISAKDLKITKKEAPFLIGKFSRGLNRTITAKDLSW